MCLGCVIDRAALRKATRSDWSPGNETDAVLLAIIQHVFAVLQGCFEVGDRNIAQPSVTDDPIVL